MPRRSDHEGTLPRKVQGRDLFRARVMLRGKRHDVYGRTRDFVFTTPQGRPLTAGVPRRALLGVLRRLKLPDSTTHALRHTFATLQIQEGTPLSVVSKLLGHRDTGTTSNVYGHLTPAMRRDAHPGTSAAVNAAAADRPNLLAYGDNLDILGRYVNPESVDLVYLDPPFNSNADYNVLFRAPDGTRAEAQVKAFGDTWKWDHESIHAFERLVEGGSDQVARTLRGLRTILSGPNPSMLAYLTMMTPRLVALRDRLKPTGSIFLHCDPTASHYLKVLMDAVFGQRMFVNEVIWRYRKWATGRYAFQRNHDVLLFYSRSDSRDRTFNQLYMDRAASTLRRFGTSRIVSGHDEAGKRVPSTVAEGDSNGTRMDDVWEIGRVPPILQHFPTEKPPDLLRRIIEVCTNPGDLVLDPFCGCGTAVIVAQRMQRRWIGIDVTHHATGLIKHRLVTEWGPGITTTYRSVGEPTTLEDAVALAKEDKYQFQAWALGLVGARDAGPIKKGGDGGMDGHLYFHDSPGGPSRHIVISVKGGIHLEPSHVRDLVGVVSREEATIGVLISLEEPTSAMRVEAAEAGTYKSPRGGRYPRVQLRTVGELLAGHGLVYPPAVEEPFRPTLWEAGDVARTATKRQPRIDVQVIASLRTAAPPEAEAAVSEQLTAESVRGDYAQRSSRRQPSRTRVVSQFESPQP